MLTQSINNFYLLFVCWTIHYNKYICILIKSLFFTKRDIHFFLHNLHNLVSIPAVSLFFLVCSAKRARCATTGPHPSISRRIAHTCASLTNPGEKERLLAVYKFQLLLIQYGLKYKFYIIFIYLHKLDIRYRKIPKISPGAYIFQRPFLKGLFLEGLI